MATLATLVVRLGMNAGEFFSEMEKAESRTSRLMGGIGKNVQSLGKAALGGIGVMAAGAVGGFAGVVSQTMPLASDFQSQLTDLQIAASQSGLSFDELHNAALAVGGDTKLLGVSATGAADSMTGLYKAGLSTTEIFGNLQGYMAGTAELGGALRASIDLAAASELDMVQTSDLAAVMLATFGQEMKTAEERAEFVNRALDNTVKAADASVAEVTGLADALVNVGPTAAAMGIGIEDVNNALAILSTRGIQGAEAGTTLKSMLANMRRPTKTVVSALDELGVSLYNAEGVFVGLPNLIEQMEGAMAGLTQEQRDQYIQTLAGTYGMNALNTLLQEGVGGWNAMASATESAAGIQTQAAAKAATFAGQMEALKGTIETLKIGIGEAFLPVATDMLGIFSNIVGQYGPAIAEFFQNNLGPALETGAQFIGRVVENLGWLLELFKAGELDAYAFSEALMDLLPREVVSGFFTLYEAIMPIVTKIADWIGQNIELQDVLIALGIAIASVVIPAVVSLVASIAPVIAVALALIAIVALVRQAWETNFLGIRDAAQMLQTRISELWAGAKATWESFWSGFSPSLERMHGRLREFWAEIQPKLMEAWDSLQELWAEVEALWTGTLKPALDRLTEALGLGGDETGTFAETVGALAGLLVEIQLEGLINMITIAVEAMTAAIDGVKGAMAAWRSIIESVKNALAGLEVPGWLRPGSPTPLEIGIRGINEALRDLNISAGFGGGRGEGMIILAPVFLDPRDVVMAGGEVDYAAIGKRLRQLQGAI